MRPHDVPVLLKIALHPSTVFQFKDLSRSLYISASEISESLHRSKIAGLVSYSKTQVHRQNLCEFIEHGFKYVFPAERGSVTVGIPTSSSHPFMQKHFSVNEACVWPDFNGTKRGIAIEPLYKNQVKAALEDERLYKLLALMDVIRIEKLREVNVALQEIKKELLP